MGNNQRLEMSYTEDTTDLAKRGIMERLESVLAGITTAMTLAKPRIVLTREAAP